MLLPSASRFVSARPRPNQASAHDASTPRSRSTPVRPRERPGLRLAYSFVDVDQGRCPSSGRCLPRVRPPRLIRVRSARHVPSVNHERSSHALSQSQHRRPFQRGRFRSEREASRLCPHPVFEPSIRLRLAPGADHVDPQRRWSSRPARRRQPRRRVRGDVDLHRAVSEAVPGRHLGPAHLHARRERAGRLRRAADLAPGPRRRGQSQPAVPGTQERHPDRNHRLVHHQRADRSGRRHFRPPLGRCLATQGTSPTRSASRPSSTRCLASRAWAGLSVQLMAPTPCRSTRCVGRNAGNPSR